MTPWKFREAIRSRVRSSWILTLGLLALHMWAKEGIRREQVERTANAVVEKMKQLDEERRMDAMQTLKDAYNAGTRGSYTLSAAEALRARRDEGHVESDIGYGGPVEEGER